MDTNNASTPCTGLAIAHDLVGQVLTAADFSALDDLIKKLGDRSASLTADEKTAAIQVVTDWNDGVVQRIKANADMAREILSFLDGATMYPSTMDRCVQLFHDVVGDTPEYQAYEKALDNYAQVKADAPLEIPASPEMTVAQSDRLSLDNQAARLAHDRKVDGAKFQVMKAAKAYIASLRAMPEVQDAASKLKAYSRKATRMQAECTDKASRAKLNLAIADAETRNLLHDLLDFSKSI